MTVVAAIDCGTNSIRLLVSEDGRDLAREMTIVRLGQGVDRTGWLDPAAIERTRVALVSYAETIEKLGAGAVRMVATSATRDASNREDFVAMVRSVLGVDPEVVSGDEEARLSYAGATAGLEIAYPALVADIGGGSTELVLGDGPGRDAVRAALSVDIGCVRLTERRLLSDPPAAQEIRAAQADIDEALDRAREVVPLSEATTFVGLAGSVTTVVAHALGLGAYDADRIHGTRIPPPMPSPRARTCCIERGRSGPRCRSCIPDEWTSSVGERWSSRQRWAQAAALNSSRANVTSSTVLRKAFGKGARVGEEERSAEHDQAAFS